MVEPGMLYFPKWLWALLESDFSGLLAATGDAFGALVELHGFAA